MLEMKAKKSLSATNLAVHEHLGCDLYIHNIYHRSMAHGQAFTPDDSSEITAAYFKRGLDWEARLLSWLDQSNLLLRVPPIPLEAKSLLENILADDRSHFYIAGLTFWPPSQELEKRFADEQTVPLAFGLAKPDLLEITKVDGRIQWRVIDAKASKHIKVSHHIQIYFYDLCLNFLLYQPPYQSTELAGIWLPPDGDFSMSAPSQNDIKSISTSNLAPIVDELLFKKLPKIIALPFDEVSWHFNPLCQGCRFEPECKSRAVDKAEIGSMPNISIEDAKVLKDVLRISDNPTLSKSEKCLPDIEELHKLFEDSDKVKSLTRLSPSVVKRAKQVLAIPKKVLHSPIIQAARSDKVQVVQRRNFTCPNKEDISIIISVVDDPSSPMTGGHHFGVTVHSQDIYIAAFPSFVCPTSELIVKLSELIRSIQKTQPANTCQFYVWSRDEHLSLQNAVIKAALTSTASGDDIGLCIGALCQGASLLQTAFQPLLLSGALLSFLADRKWTTVQYQVCLKRMGLSTEGTAEVLRKRIGDEVRRLQEASKLRGPVSLQKELGQVAQVVVLKKEIERQLALPIPGYWDLPECASLFSSTPVLCPSTEQIFRAYKNPTHDRDLELLLISRNQIIYKVLTAFRSRATSATGKSFLINGAKALSITFVNVCKEIHIRKLFFMQQFEVLAKLTELWQSRIDGCPEDPLLRYHDVVQTPKGPQHIFELLSGTVDLPGSPQDFPLYDKLLVRDASAFDDGSEELPVEALFDDLAVSGLVFPLNEYTMGHWRKQHPRVKQELSTADVRNVYLSPDRRHTLVVLHIWTSRKFNFEKGDVYRLSPRLVDFNTSKILSALFEVDLRWEFQQESSDDGEKAAQFSVPFLQLIIDSTSLGKLPSSDQCLQTERKIQQLFHDLRGRGNSIAGSLVLKASQHQACQLILSNRLSVIWGPPGTGKTYTLSLSLLRLIVVERQLDGPRQKIIFITATTHAAVEAFHAKLVHLTDAHRSLPQSKAWLDNVEVHIISRSSNYPPPLGTGSSVRIYAGTMYQLYNFTKKYPMEVDTLIIDEAGQVSLGAASLVMRSVSPQGRIVIAGDSEQLAPILSAQYPSLKTCSLFGSLLDCLQSKSTHGGYTSQQLASAAEDPAEARDPSPNGGIIQLIENFRLNPDLGEFVSTIYSCKFKSQKSQTEKLGEALSILAEGNEKQLTGIPREIHAPIRTFLIALSKVISKKGQSILTPPILHPVSETSGAACSNSPVSLALIRLQISSAPHNSSYESDIHIEATVAAALVFFLQVCFPSEKIFVATPHRIQRDAVKAALSKVITDNSLEELFGRMDIGCSTVKSRVTVDTIERLQGSEASFVLCLFAVPKSSAAGLDFLLERRRLNVAISRAQTLCIVLTSDRILCPPVRILANEETAKGYAFIRAFQQRAWSYDLPIQVEDILKS